MVSRHTPFKEGSVLQKIRAAVHEGRFKLTEHAFDRMASRKIKLSHVIEGLLHGRREEEKDS